MLSNQAMPGYLKIGFTTENVEQRARTLSSVTGVPIPFEVEYWCITEAPQDVEKQVHFLLANSRVKDNREFFEIDLVAAVEQIEKIAKIPTSIYRKPETLIRTCKRCGHDFERSVYSELCPQCGF